MKVLLDTCTLSEIYREREKSPAYQAIDAIPSEALFISVISIGEIVKGIALLPDGVKKTSLSEWIQTLETIYLHRILPIDKEVVRIWGVLTARAQKRGRVIPVADGLIAATALAHGLHVMTRNVADFEETGALLLNPWA